MECFYARSKISTDFASEMPMHINNCGYIRKLEKDVSVNRPNGRSDYHLLFNVSGEISINGERLSEGDAYIVLPWEKQEYTYVSKENAIYYWLHFSGTNIPELLRSMSLGSGKYSLFDSKGEAEDIIRRVIKSISENWESADAYASGQLCSLLALLAKPCHTKNPFSRAIKRLSNPGDKVTVAELSEMYNMSEGHFIRQFKAYTGYTPLEYRASKIVENAKSLLSGTDMPITDISEALGFDDPLYFSRVFKKSVGVSPRDYRKNYI